MNPESAPGFDLNCDLGEGEPLESTAALMAFLDSANIACGGHAGTEDSMRACLGMARVLQVHAGAHPGLPDAGGFGRTPGRVPQSADVEAWLVTQVGTLQEHARAAGIPLHHVKLHGALYHLTDRYPELARAYLGTVARRWPECRIYARAGGLVSRLAPSFGLEAWPEAFLDRAYHSDGRLVPRGSPGAVLADPAILVARVAALQQGTPWSDADGRELRLQARTLCVHGDSPAAHALLAAARSALGPRSAPQKFP